MKILVLICKIAIYFRKVESIVTHRRESIFYFSAQWLLLICGWCWVCFVYFQLIINYIIPWNLPQNPDDAELETDHINLESKSITNTLAEIQKLLDSKYPSE